MEEQRKKKYLERSSSSDYEKLKFERELDIEDVEDWVAESEEVIEDTEEERAAAQARPWKGKRKVGLS